MTANNLPETVTSAIDAYFDAAIADPYGTYDARQALNAAIQEAISAAASRAANEVRAERAESEKYNGWRNYATWRVNLELVDDYLDSQAQDIEAGYLDKYSDVYALSESLKDYIGEFVSGETTGEIPEITASYADAFLSDVDWYEIAEHFAHDRPECMASEEEEEETCSECGASLDDGEGYDGLCGNCADKAEPDETEGTQESE